MKSTLFSMFAGLLLLTACGKSNQFEITGTITGSEATVVYLQHLETPRDAVTVDSFIMNEEGTFKFVQEDKNGLFRLNFDRANITLSLNKGEKVKVTAEIDEEGQMTYELEGSPESQAIKELIADVRSSRESINSQINTMVAAAPEGQMDPATEAQIMSFYEAEMKELSTRNKAFIEANKTNHAGLFATQLLDNESDFDFMDTYASELSSSELADDSFAKSFLERVNSIKAVAIGQPAPEIDLPAPDGSSIPLSSLKGKYVLIDFWASWCKPCREENPNVVLAHKKFNAKNFTVYGVSLDKNKEPWVKAILDDQLEWAHVSDLEYWSSAAARKYQVNSIPANFLVDPNGNIVAKNLRGEELQTKLAEILG